MYLSHLGLRGFSFGLIGTGRNGHWEGVCT